jgi:hypothetical protein
VYSYEAFVYKLSGQPGKFMSVIHAFLSLWLIQVSLSQYCPAYFHYSSNNIYYFCSTKCKNKW